MEERKQKRVREISTSAGVRQRRSPAVLSLESLKPGESAVLTYNAATPFAKWIAVQRHRFDKSFKWERAEGTKRFRIWLEGKPLPPPVVTTAPPLSSADIAFNGPHHRRIVAALALYRFAPLHGKGGGLIRAACREADYSVSNGWRLITRLVGNQKKLRDLDGRGREFLSRFVMLTEASTEAVLVRDVYERLKRGGVAQVKLNTRLYNMLDKALTRLEVPHEIRLVEGGQTGTYHIRNKRKRASPRTAS